MNKDTKDKIGEIVSSYFTFNPKKIRDGFKESAKETVNAPLNAIRKDIEMFKYLSGKHDQNQIELTFEEAYKLHNCNENQKQTNYTRFCWLALFFLMITSSCLVVGIKTTIDMKDSALMIFNLGGFLVGSSVFFANYFKFSVKAHCLRTGSFKNKLKTFTYLNGILPNPYEDVRTVVNEKGTNLAVFLETKEEQEDNIY